MEFLIADTFTDSLSRLTNDEQKAVKTTAFDLQLNAATPGMRLHKLDRAKDKNFWSVRVSSDVRLIVHKTDRSLLLCYVDHHDKAYAWAERRQLQAHPTTGAAQFVEVRETIREVVVPTYVRAAPSEVTRRLLFSNLSDAALLAHGVPAEYVSEVRLADEDTLLELSEHLPAEAAEALLELATGGQPRAAKQAEATASPFSHPDAQRRFRVVANVEELERALDSPWDRWLVFLHPAQREFVERQFTGPARVSGAAGTGKTIVALHRAVFLARSNPGARVLLTTFSDVLANLLRGKLRRLIGNEPRLAERLEVLSIDAAGLRLCRALAKPAELAGRALVLDVLKAAAAEVGGHKFSTLFLMTEWEQVVDAWQLDSWEAYRDVIRLGRKTRLPEARRAVLWSIFERLRAGLSARGVMTPSAMFTTLASLLAETAHPPFDFVVVDEAQDIGVAHLRFLAAFGKDRPDALFFAGDLGQRIFQQPFSWLALGVDVRGRSKTLKVNYRTSHQIRMQADRLLGLELSDADGNREERDHTVSVFNGPPPEIRVFDTQAAEIDYIALWLTERVKESTLPHEIGIFVRSPAELDRARAAVGKAGLECRVLDDRVDTASGFASVGTMHLAKGLEFRVVVAMACDDEVVPLQQRIETVGDDADLQEVYDTERHLLYVACTRARDRLLVTSTRPASEFLDDLVVA